MGEPVIFDDGGSTRIKRLLPGTGVGEMDSLLDVDILTSPVGARGSDHTVNEAFSKVLIVCQDKTGPFTLSFSGFAKVEVSSALNQQLSAEIVAGKLKITVFSMVSDPHRGIQNSTRRSVGTSSRTRGRSRRYRSTGPWCMTRGRAERFPEQRRGLSSIRV